jgi:exonuclease VII small subunit
MPKLTDPTLKAQRVELSKSKRRGDITERVFNNRVKKLEEKQLESNEAEYDRRYKLYQEGKKYKKNLSKKLKENSNASIDIDIKKIPKSVSIDDVLKIIQEKRNKSVLTVGDHNIILNEDNFSKTLKGFRDIFYDNHSANDSFSAFAGTVKSNNSIFTVSNVENNNTYTNWLGAWFKWNHTLDFDFTRYGIYKTNQETNYVDSCLVLSLQKGGLESMKVEMVKTFVKDRNIPMSKIDEICDKIESKIIIKRNDGRAKTVYGKKYETTFNIGLIENHYFIIEPVNITSFAIKNYNEIKHLDKWFLISEKNGKYYKRDPKLIIDSFDAIKLIVDNKDKLLVEIDYSNSSIASSQFYDKIENKITNLEYDDDEDKGCKLISEIEDDDYIEKKDVDAPINDKTIDFQNVFFDFETYLDDNNRHIPYVVCSYSEGKMNYFTGEYCAFNFLKSLKTHSRLIAHNANYDYRFLIQYLRNINEISRGSRLIGCSGTFFKIKVEIKDSYHLISKPLRDFPESFKLGDVVKEVMPYDLYNKENIEKRYLNIQNVLINYINEKDKEQFLNNITKWKLQDGDYYDIIMYSIRYCMIDCNILEQGYNKFRTWMLECVNIDIDNKLTIASLAHEYFIKQGCYNGVYQISGVPQIFIQGTVVGGRTMVSENKKISIEEKINDFDAVSLYPSAMERMDGFLKGKPKVIKEHTYDFISKQDGYFVDIIINSVGIKRKFPLMSLKNNDGIRIFTNDMIGKTIRVDKYTLEDLITFHNITFTIVRGYYFNDGFNTKIKDTIRFLFNERLIKKKQGNPIQEVYKLIMNSGYGKSIMKPIDSETKIFDDVKRFKTFLSRNYNWVKEFTYFGDKVKVKCIKPINHHYNIAHVGSMILSMSKRIMNEVMCSAEDSNIDLYYQDTDSIHIKDSDISILSSIYRNKYNKDLIGKGLGQFHSDFQMNGCKDIIANNSIFLGKKCYIDRLEGINSKGEKEIDYHIRMKGIPNSVVLYTSKKLGYDNAFEMYKDLYKGKKIEFDLTNDGSKCNFKMNKDYSVETLEVFKRVICF